MVASDVKCIITINTCLFKQYNLFLRRIFKLCNKSRWIFIHGPNQKNVSQMHNTYPENIYFILWLND